MAEEFTPINTQEEFDAAVAARYGDVANLQQQITTLTGERDTQNQTIADLQGKVKGYETAALKSRIARENHIPYELADRLTGETEEDIRRDAENLSKFIKSVRGPAPLFNPEPEDPKNTQDAALMQMIQNMKGV